MDEVGEETAQENEGVSWWMWKGEKGDKKEGPNVVRRKKKEVGGLQEIRVHRQRKREEFAEKKEA